MAHQLDFKVTLWSDDNDALLKFEQALATVAEAPTGWECVRLARLLDDMFHKVSKVDVHSIDINWDNEEEDPLEKEQNLPRPTREQLYQGDWSKFDEEEAKRIEKLLEDADKQSDWGKTLSDYGEFL